MSPLNAEGKAAGFLLAATVGFAGLLLLSSMDEGWWRARVEYSATLASGAGLSAGLPVTVAHLQVGRVEEVWLAPDRSVHLRLSVDARYAEFVREDSVADAVMTTGGKAIELGAGQGPPLADGGALVQGENFDPLLALAELDLAATLLALKNAVADLNELAASLGLGESELPELIALMRTMLEDVRQGTGTLGQLLTSPALAEQFSVSLTETAEASRALKQSTENLDRTLDVLYTTSVSVGEGAEKINTGMPQVTSGAVELQQAMIDVQTSLDRMDTTLNQVDATLKRVNSLPTFPRREEEEPK